MLNDDVTQTSIWQNLQARAAKTQAAAMNSDIALPEPLSVNDVTFDFSNHHCGVEDMEALLALAERQDVAAWRDRMVAGEAINKTENRAVGHIWLRQGKRDEVLHALQSIKQISDDVRGGGRFRHVVNIGIGGSDLGPRMVCHALAPIMGDQPVSVHFVANIDPTDFAMTVQGLEPEETLFILCSKTMTTMETLANLKLARQWLQQAGIRDIGQHFIGVSTNAQAMDDLGIPETRRLGFWDWVGGRYSLWSAIGISIAIAYGFDVFSDLLGGAKAMDDHFLNTPIKQNVPVLSALLGVWYRNFFGMQGWAIHPYAQALEYLVPYLQQLDMESNGKSVSRDGVPLSYETGPIIFGQVGTNGQHAYFQWLHQGMTLCPNEFIGVKTTPFDADNHTKLCANMQAQIKALAEGRRNDKEPHRHFSGARPSTAVWLKELSPTCLGALLAYYEHRTFVQGVIWQVNSFDQWGVELGKVMTKDILAQG